MKQVLKDKKVAVIIRTKDREILLERALRSVLDQTYDNFEVVIVNDGGSKTKVNAVIKKLGDKRITAIHNQAPTGRWQAANQGIGAVKSDYIVLLDDDDSWLPTFLDEATQRLRESGAKGVATSSSRVVEEVKGESITKISESPYYTYDGAPLLAFTFLQENLVPTNAFVFSRSAYDLLSGYDETMQVSADWDFNRRFIELFDIETIPESLARIHHRLDAKEEAMNNTVLKGRLLHYTTQANRLNEAFRADLKNGSIASGLLQNQLRHQLKTQKRIEQDLETVKKQLNELLGRKPLEKPSLSHKTYRALKRRVPTSIKKRLKR